MSLKGPLEIKRIADEIRILSKANLTRICNNDIWQIIQAFQKINKIHNRSENPLSFNGKDKKFIADLSQRAETYNYCEPDKIKSAEMFGRTEGLGEAIKIFRKFYCT